MTPHASDATEGAPSKSLAKRIVHLVDERARPDQPAVAESEVATIAHHIYARDGATTSPREAIAIARTQGEVMRVRHPTTDRPYLGPVAVDTAVWTLGPDATADDARAAAGHEAETSSRQGHIGVWNRAAARLSRDADDTGAE